MYQTILKSLRDILSPTVLGFILKVGLGSIALWLTIFWLFWDQFETFVSSYLSWIPWEWLQSSISYIAAPLVGYTLIILTISTLTSLYSEKLLIKIAKKHYPQQMVQENIALTGSMVAMVKSSLIFILLFVVLFPFIFVPVLGQVVMLYLWSILLRDPMIYDVGTLFIHDPKVLKKRQKGSTFIAMIASLFNYIPLLNIFAPIFAQILFLHHILKNEN
jgi:uncharacterized protein involved in cysteine biosynthesis